MSKHITPYDEPVSREQIGKICDKLTNALHQADIPKKHAQRIIASKDNLLINELVLVVRKHIEAKSTTIVRPVVVDPKRSAKKVFEDFELAGRTVNLNDDIVATMPKSEGGKIKVTLFKSCGIKPVLEQYKIRGLKPANPFDLAKFNEDDPHFSNSHSNVTFWDTRSWLMFRPAPSLDVGQQDPHIHDDYHFGVWTGWWLAGVPI